MKKAQQQERIRLSGSLNDALVDNYALFETEILENGADGEEKTIGMTSTYQQQYGGIPLENNFFTVCSDKDGVFSIVNRWSDIKISKSSEVAIVSIDDAKAMILKDMNHDYATIENAGYIYKMSEDGTYRLNIKVTLDNNLQYYVDTVSGEIVTE